MNRTSPGSRLVSMAARSPCLSSAGPLVCLMFTCNSLAIIVASVVLPRPGGPESRIWSRTSPRPRAALMKIRNCSFLASWPMKSFRSRGRRVMSSASSSCDTAFEVSPLFSSGMRYS